MWFALNILTLVLMQYPLVLVHEFGHASAAAILRFRIFSIKIGYGKQIFKTRRLGFPLTVHVFPSIGLTLATPVSRSWWRLRQWLYIFAGPATHLIFLAISYFASPESFYLGYSLPKVFEQFAPLESFILVNILLLFAALYPRAIKKPMGTYYTDGYQLFRIPFGKSISYDELERAIPRVEALELMNEGDYSGAIEIFERELANTPTDNLLRHDLAVANLHYGKYEQARDLFIELLDAPEFQATEPQKNLLFNNIAWVNAVVNRSDWLEQADEYSASAYNSAPGFVYFVGTRGTVLVRLGRNREGIELLKKALKSHSTAASRAAVACFIAIGEAQEGNFDKARQWIGKARKESPDHILNKSAEKEIDLISGSQGGS